MKKLFILTAIASVMALSTHAKGAGEYDAQIDALQNELLKIKQEMNSDKNKAYFKKGRGLSIKSVDGKYSFQIKGRAMFDLTQVGGFHEGQLGAADHYDGFGAEIRRIRFSIKVDTGDGWGFAFQPDFAETVTDDSASNSTTSAAKGVDVKDAYISKKIKGLGKFSFGNVKSAGGMYENTSSNSLLMMERPMYNEFANLAHRAGIHYDTGGAFGKNLHVKVSMTYGNEGAWRQEQEDGDGTETSWNHSVATHYTQNLGKKHQYLIGGSYTIERPLNDNARGVSFRQQGVHTLGEKIVDTTLSNIISYGYGGPQAIYTNGPFFASAEYYFISGDRKGNYSTYDDYAAQGGAIYAQYFVNGNANVKISGKKGVIGGVKCKSSTGCTAIKAMFESIDSRDGELSATATAGTHAKVLHVGFNHYFTSNVRIMVDIARGLYLGGHTDWVRDQTGRHTMTSAQTRLHLKF